MAKHPIELRKLKDADPPAPPTPPAGEGIEVPTDLALENQLQSVLDFSDPLTIARVLGGINWSVRQELDTLVKFAKTCGPKDAMRAIAQIRTIIREAMEQSGLLARVREVRTTSSDGKVDIAQMVEVVRMVRQPLLAQEGVKSRAQIQEGPLKVEISVEAEAEAENSRVAEAPASIHRPPVERANREPVEGDSSLPRQPRENSGETD